MKETDNNGFIKHLLPGDIGLILSNNFFAKLQNWYRKRFKEGSLKASHGFYLNNPPELTEANGLYISKSMIFKNIGDTTKCWVFRYENLSCDGLSNMNSGAELAYDSGGHYSIMGIWRFVKSFITGKINQKNEKGVFCTEFTSDLISEGVPEKDYIQDRKPWQIDPSYQLNWFMTEGKDHNWKLIGHYNGEGKYFIS